MPDDPSYLRRASSDEIADALAFARRFDGSRRFDKGSEMMAKITVEHLVRDLEQAMAVATPSHPGMTLALLTEAMRARLGLPPDDQGVVVTEVAQNSVAARRRIMAGDVVEAVGDHPVSTPGEVKQALKAVSDRRLPFAPLLVRGEHGPRWVPLELEADAGRRAHARSEAPAAPLASTECPYPAVPVRLFPAREAGSSFANVQPEQTATRRLVGWSRHTCDAGWHDAADFRPEQWRICWPICGSASQPTLGCG
jgi:hypothetical protein